MLGGSWPSEATDNMVEIVDVSSSPISGLKTREDGSNVNGRDASSDKYSNEDDSTKGDDIEAERKGGVDSEPTADESDEGGEEDELDSQFSLYEEILEASLETDDSSPPPNAGS